jgi:vacuolar-type H+-ATPase subunit C/Vma6
MLVLYRESDLDEAYKIDCKARAKGNEPWLKREQFRRVYESLLDMHFTRALDKTYQHKADELAEHIIGLVNKTLENSLDFTPEDTDG